MKTKFKLMTLLTSATMLMTACSQDSLVASTETTNPSTDTPISFGTYMGKKSMTTRATVGETGSIATTDVLKTKQGFGVFAHYTVNDDYAGTVTAGVTSPTALTTSNVAQTAAVVPNFMYNQKVNWDVTANNWVYTPIKYWPNGNATADNANATGTEGGKVSFFAYAPYVAVVGTDSDEGIIGMTANTVAGNPTITYKIPTDGETVDLLWGTAGTNGVTVTGTAQAGACVAKTPATPNWADRPFPVNVNLTKMKTNGKIEFKFKHALAKVGGSKVGTGAENGLQIVADLDQNGNISGADFEVAPTGSAIVGKKLTKVTVKSITISNDLDGDGDFDADDKTAGAITSKGTLDLATGQWTPDNSDEAKTEVKHIIALAATTPKNATLADLIAEPATPPAGSSNAVAFFNDTNTGVPALNAVNVYKEETNPMVFIPGTTPKLRFTINYVVRTYDTNLEKNFSEVEQTISKVITFSEAIQLNKMYNIIIHLGLTSVKFTATVEDWEETNVDTDNNPSTPNAPQQVDLPINVTGE